MTKETDNSAGSGASRQPEGSLEDKIRYALAIEVPELSITRNEVLVDRIMEYITEDTSNISASQRIEALGLLKEHFIWKRDVQRNQLFDAQNVLDAIEKAEQRAIALLRREQGGGSG